MAAQPALPLVLFHHPLFDGTVAVDDIFQFVAFSHLPDGAEPRQGIVEGGALDAGVLDHLGKAVDEVVLGQCAKHIRVHIDRPGVVKGAGEVFALGEIDPGLAPHAAVHLGSREVGIWTRGIPLRYIDAVNPAVSPTTPPRGR